MEVLNLFPQFQTFHRLKHPHNVTTLSYHYFENSVSLLTYNLYTSIGFFQIFHDFCYLFHFSSLKNGSPPENVTSVNGLLAISFTISSTVISVPLQIFHDFGLWQPTQRCGQPAKHDCPQSFSIYYTIMNNIHHFHLCFTRSISSLRFALFHFDISPTR